VIAKSSLLYLREILHKREAIEGFFVDPKPIPWLKLGLVVVLF
jgi:hypothetical protein